MAMMEFKSYKDGAWFDARVVMETRCRGGNRLRIKFFNFGDDEDEVVQSKKLKTLQDVQALRSRFRKVSLAFQDSDCSEVRPGLLVCARRPVDDSDRKFYDAVLTRVEHKEHETVKGEEVCTCEFVFDWTESGESGSCTVENICRVLETSDEELDQGLMCFLNQARERIENTPLMICGGYDLRKRNKTSNKDTRPFTGPLGLSGSVEGCNKDSNHSRTFYEATQDLNRSCKDTSLSRESLALTCYDEGLNNPYYMVIVENLERELSPFTMMEFIHQQVSITCQASVFQSKSSQPYTTGIILLDSPRNLDKLSDFLESPDHIIISSTGRPWLMTEKILVSEAQKASIQSSCVSQATAASESANVSSNELDVVISGTREYMKAKELKNLFKLFIEHQCGLNESLLHEERKISNKYR